MSPQTARRNNRQKLLDGALESVRDKGYAHTTARDVATASGANLASIGYHFGGMDALLEEVLGQCFDTWAARVEASVVGSTGEAPRVQLESALSAVIDSFEQLRPLVIACVEAFPPAIRSAVLRERLADGYARGRDAGNQMLTRAFSEQGMEVPAALAALPSVIIALCDGLMLQWLVDPASTPSAAETMDALAALAPLLAPTG
ncbi:TetR/AcrR family transcriptional regulator [Aeromicrobium sp.]|uniref:TetR/AcrR family transcriptional regulator n=1 Tax=Aeromicrobium sp. TaxID=1871063 RepID=UPI002FCBAB78